MMLIQVKAEVTPLWYEYGVVLGVPQDILNELRGMNADDIDKLIEVLDFWFRKFPASGGPSWKEVALSLREIGLNELAARIMTVYTTGEENNRGRFRSKWSSLISPSFKESTDNYRHQLQKVGII